MGKQHKAAGASIGSAAFSFFYAIFCFVYSQKSETTCWPAQMTTRIIT